MTTCIQVEWEVSYKEGKRKITEKYSYENLIRLPHNASAWT